MKALLFEWLGKAWQTVAVLLQWMAEHPLPVTIFFIFATAIISMLASQRRRDKCLRLLDDHHVSCVDVQGQVTWGDLSVYPRGLEVRFDDPYLTRRGFYKSSALFYESQLGQLLALCRNADALTAREDKERRRQVRRSFRPNVLLRTKRRIRNQLSALRDAFSKALNVMIGHLSKSRGVAGGVLSSHQQGVNQIGDSLLGVAANAYEPILERHIGRSVILQLRCPGLTSDFAEGLTLPPRTIDLPGYLVDYSKDFLAIFNIDHEERVRETLDVRRTDTLIEKDGYSIAVRSGRMQLVCTGEDMLVISGIDTGARQLTPEIVLPYGSSAEVRFEGDSLKLTLELTSHVDMVCPRSLADVYFGGEQVNLQKEQARKPVLENH